jgi:hypothetical protein
VKHRFLILCAAVIGWRCNFDNVWRSGTEEQLENVNGAIEIYRGTHQDYPDSLAELVHPSDGSAPVLSRVPRDGWGRALLYRHPSAHAETGFDLFSAGQDGIAATADDLVFREVSWMAAERDASQVRTE